MKIHPFVLQTSFSILFATFLSASFISFAQEIAASQEKPTPLPDITVTASPSAFAPSPLIEKYQLPQTSRSLSIAQAQETVNLMDTEDTVKYFPSLFVRKRNNGDTQPVLATRTWGVNSSARSLVYADDLLLSALIGNNNSIGAPRWGLVSPEEIERIDFLYGPFAAAYPGNSMGGVLQITTKMPQKLTGTFSQTEAFQKFSRYGTRDVFRTDQTNFSLGNRHGSFAWLLSGNFQNSYSQPLTWITSGTAPAGTSGTIWAQNKLGAAAHVVGAGGLLHTKMENLKAKFAWDLTDTLKATYQIGLWNNDANSTVQTYLNDATGEPTFGGVAGFASGNYSLRQTHLSNAFSLKTNTGGHFDWDFSVSNYVYLRDIQRNPYDVNATGTNFTSYGKIARLDGTQWTTGDLKGIWRPDAFGASHEISFGLHTDREYLSNPTYQTTEWNGGPNQTASLYTLSRGITSTNALWIQDAWRFAPNFKLTAGGRFEVWEARDGFNLNTSQTAATGAITSTTAVSQPSVSANRFSPKLSVNWTPTSKWELTASFGQAYRFPTVTELYQIVQTGATFSTPNPNLKPENVLTEELALQRKFKDGSVRISVFNENVQDALIAQTNLLSGPTPVNFVTNVDEVRNLGVELAVQKDHVAFEQLSVFGSLTYVDSKIEKDSTWSSPTGTTVVGKHAPYVPDWRATIGATLRPNENWSLTGAVRYSGKQYSTLDNTDVNPNVYGAFDRFLVVDARVQYKMNAHASLNVGIDNLTDTKFTLFHPFPGRTYTAGVKLEF
ncbi:MAG: TonB-dependent receptor [Verrucomicrobiota bacterium]